ncbi:MAG: hydroxymethylbilane synthase, partial [Sphingopyxis sp.]
VGAVGDAPTARAVLAERAFLGALGGDCRSPVAALAVIGADGRMTLRAQLLAADGCAQVTGECVSESMDADPPQAAALAARLLGEAPRSITALFGG